VRWGVTERSGTVSAIEFRAQLGDAKAMSCLISSPRFALGRRPARAWFLALATAPWWTGLGCGDDATPDGSGAGSGGAAGSSGSSAGSAGSSGVGGSAAGSAGTGGSAGGGNNAGSSGNSNLSDAGTEPDSGNPDASMGLAFTISSPAFENVPGCGPDDPETCALFPDENTNLGAAANVSPEINWTPGPARTQSYAVALHDLSNLNGQDPFTHWVMWNIPASSTGLPAELPEGASPAAPAPAGSQQVSYSGSGTNGGYVGSGACGNVYEFVLFALGTASIDPGSTNPDAVEAAIAGSSDVLDTATMRARSDPAGPSCN
jgi:phosphatidylethanolamine-binding protein (PEBP) family uncharacterized protein